MRPSPLPASCRLPPRRSLLASGKLVYREVCHQESGTSKPGTDEWKNAQSPSTVPACYDGGSPTGGVCGKPVDLQVHRPFTRLAAGIFSSS